MRRVYKRKMEIHRVETMPYPHCKDTLGVINSQGVIHLKKNLPFLIQTVVLFHEVGHYIFGSITHFLFQSNLSESHLERILRVFVGLWVLLFEVKDQLICKPWIYPTQRKDKT